MSGYMVVIFQCQLFIIVDWGALKEFVIANVGNVIFVWNFIILWIRCRMAISHNYVLYTYCRNYCWDIALHKFFCYFTAPGLTGINISQHCVPIAAELLSSEQNFVNINTNQSVKHIYTIVSGCGECAVQGVWLTALQVWIYGSFLLP